MGWGVTGIAPCRGMVLEVAPEGPVLVTWANLHYLDFVLNWVAHVRALGIGAYLVGAMDDGILKVPPLLLPPVSRMLRQMLGMAHVQAARAGTRTLPAGQGTCCRTGVASQTEHVCTLAAADSHQLFSAGAPPSRHPHICHGQRAVPG